MAVTVYWASDNSGTLLNQVVDHGSVAKGNNSGATTFYLYHNGQNDITNCGFYIQPRSGLYEGDFSALTDYQELIDWGDSTNANGFGGYMINMNATGAWANGWAAVGDKFPAYGFVCRSGVADSFGNAQTLMSEMGCSSSGVVQNNYPNGYGINVRFQCRIAVPSNETSLGQREIDLCLRYSYTS